MRKVSRKICIFAILLCVVLCTSVFAAGNITTVQTVTSSDSIRIFVRGIDDAAEDYKFQIGNKACKDVSVKSVLDEAIPMQTLILVDNSLSIPQNDREKILTFLNSFISDRADKEKFCIATFGESLELRTDMTSDYSSLKTAIDQLNFVDRDTYLTDVLYSLIDQINAENAPILNRILIISDGVDNKSIGITRSELSDKIKDTPYLIYTVGCSTGKNNEQLENMFSLSRQTNAKSYLIDDYDDVVSIVREISNDRGIKIVQPDLDGVALDGSVQNSILTYSVGGEEYSVEAKIKLPFGAEAEAETVEESESASSEQKYPEAAPALEEEVTQEEPEQEEGFFARKISVGSLQIPMIVLIIVAAVLFIIICIIIIRIIISTKKKKNIPEYAYSEGSGNDSDKTELLFDDDKTELINENSTQMLFEGEDGHTLRLADLKDPTITYQTSLMTTVVIGRKAASCSLLIDYDKTVSARHCEINYQNGHCYIKDAGSANGTFVNGKRIFGDPEEIYSGDVLKFGRLEMTVEIK